MSIPYPDQSDTPAQDIVHRQFLGEVVNEAANSIAYALEDAGWDISRSSAFTELTLTSNPLESQYITIRYLAYYFYDVITNAYPGQVRRGATPNETLDNLINAINAGPGAGVDYSQQTYDYEIFSPRFMTAAAAPYPYVVSANSDGGNWYVASWCAFDSDQVGGWVPNTNTCWVKVDHGEGNTNVMAYYSIQVDVYGGASTPKTWTMQGSNDDVNWDVVDTVASETVWAAYETKFYIVDTQTTTYRYFKLNVTANNGSAPRIWEIKFYKAVPSGAANPDVYAVKKLSGTLASPTSAVRLCTRDTTASGYGYPVTENLTNGSFNWPTMMGYGWWCDSARAPGGPQVRALIANTSNNLYIWVGDPADNNILNTTLDHRLGMVAGRYYHIVAHKYGFYIFITGSSIQFSSMIVQVPCLPDMLQGKCISSCSGGSGVGANVVLNSVGHGYVIGETFTGFVNGARGAEGLQGLFNVTPLTVDVIEISDSSSIDIDSYVPSSAYLAHETGQINRAWFLHSSTEANTGMRHYPSGYYSAKFVSCVNQYHWSETGNRSCYPTLGIPGTTCWIGDRWWLVEAPLIIYPYQGDTDALYVGYLWGAALMAKYITPDTEIVDNNGRHWFCLTRADQSCNLWIRIPDAEN